MASDSPFCDYLRQIENIKVNDDEMLFYRGVKDASFRLEPGLIFETSVKESDAYHSLLLEYPEEFDTKSHLTNLAKMQHYGLPTRLLDFSDNILTAAMSHRKTKVMLMAR